MACAHGWMTEAGDAAFSIAASFHDVLAINWYAFYPSAYDPSDWAIILPSSAAPTSPPSTPT